MSLVGAPSPVDTSAHTASAFIWSSSSFPWTVISTFWNVILLLAVSLEPLRFPHCSPSKHYKKQSEAALPGSFLLCLGGVFAAVTIHGDFPCVGLLTGDSTSLVPENKGDRGQLPFSVPLSHVACSTAFKRHISWLGVTPGGPLLDSGGGTQGHYVKSELCI